MTATTKRDELARRLRDAGLSLEQSFDVAVIALSHLREQRDDLIRAAAGAGARNWQGVGNSSHDGRQDRQR